MADQEAPKGMTTSAVNKAVQTDETDEFNQEAPKGMTTSTSNETVKSDETDKSKSSKSSSDTSAQTHSTQTPSIQTHATTPPPSPKVADIIEDRFRFLDEVVKAEASSHKDLGGLDFIMNHVEAYELWDYLLDDGPHPSQLMRWLKNGPQVVISQPLRQRLLQWSPASPGDKRTLAAANFLFVAGAINEIVFLPPAGSIREEAGEHLEHLGLIQPRSAIEYLDRSWSALAGWFQTNTDLYPDVVWGTDERNPLVFEIFRIYAPDLSGTRGFASWLAKDAGIPVVLCSNSTHPKTQKTNTETKPQGTNTTEPKPWQTNTTEALLRETNMTEARACYGVATKTIDPKYIQKVSTMTFKHTQAISEAYKLATPPSLTFVLSFEADAPNAQLISVASRLDIKMDPVFTVIGSWLNAQEHNSFVSLCEAHENNQTQSSTTVTQGRTWTVGGNAGGIVQPLNITSSSITFGFNASRQSQQERSTGTTYQASAEYIFKHVGVMGDFVRYAILQAADHKPYKGRRVGWNWEVTRKRHGQPLPFRSAVQVHIFKDHSIKRWRTGFVIFTQIQIKDLCDITQPAYSEVDLEYRITSDGKIDPGTLQQGDGTIRVVNRWCIPNDTERMEYLGGNVQHWEIESGQTVAPVGVDLPGLLSAYYMV